tara:strand:- start:69 stop:476 length:408 start_codon:yes stop_codon:yes gene_type:complete
MKIINIVIALAIFTGACMIGSANTGGMGALWDIISLAIVVMPSYFLVAASTNTYKFYKDKSSLLLFGNLAWGFGLIGTVVGFIFTCAGMASPPPPGVDPTAALVSSIAIALITLLYGLLVKYFIVMPWAHSIKGN